MGRRGWGSIYFMGGSNLSFYLSIFLDIYLFIHRLPFLGMVRVSGTSIYVFMFIILILIMIMILVVVTRICMLVSYAYRPIYLERGGGNLLAFRAFGR